MQRYCDGPLWSRLLHRSRRDWFGCKILIHRELSNEYWEHGWDWVRVFLFAKKKSWPKHECQNGGKFFGHKRHYDNKLSLEIWSS